MRSTLVLSSGVGPKPVRDFLLLLTAYFEQLFDQLGLAQVERHVQGDPASPRSVSYELQGTAQAMHQLKTQEGSHVLIATNQQRQRASRKRWFVGCTVLICEPLPEKASVVTEQQVKWSFCRASGHGGQNVNKRSTAVRAIHEGSGLQVRASEQRSQRDNRRLAMDRLREKLESQTQHKRERAQTERRMLHYRVVRGQQVCSYWIDREGRLCASAT